MQKNIIEREVYYNIIWSQDHRYEKYDASKVLPELPGIVCLMYREKSKTEYLIFYACWRDGCRVGLKKFLDPDFSRYAELARRIDKEKLYYKYTVVDTKPTDLQDILYWLIKNYAPLYNSSNYEDSRRYRSINVKEGVMAHGDVVEKFHATHR